VRRAALIITVLTVAAVVVQSATTTSGASASRPTVGRPNILFVLADDLDLAAMSFMPHTRALIGDRGVTFDNYFVTNSACCPSRTSMLRGQYSHNTGVWSNGGGNGGFARALANGIERDTIATRLRDAGYRTLLAGKYLNGYPGDAGRRYIPPGWSSWASPADGYPYSEYRYLLNHDGHLRRHRRRPRDYGTTVYSAITRRFVRRSVDDGQPFFAFLSVYAPHEPAIPAPRDIGTFAGAQAPRTPSFNQADVTGLPSYLRSLPAFSSAETTAIDALYERRIESLQAVDRAVVALVRELRARHQLRHTYVVFSSDNGFHLGQHRLPAGKLTAYDTDTHVPLLIRGPGIRAGTHVGQLATNVDLAPTFAAMAGVRPAAFTDGESFLPLAHGRQGVRPPREAVLVEHRVVTGATDTTPREPGTLEPSDQDQKRSLQLALAGKRPIADRMLVSGRGLVPDYDAIRTDRYLYVRYGHGERELYDVVADPDQLHNLIDELPDVARALDPRLDALRSCARASCRRAARAPEPPASTVPAR
jgi:N-acetylglucosamine-6-sulfatase